MSNENQIVVTDWIQKKSIRCELLKLTLNSDQRKTLRGKRISDCKKNLLMQLPREGILNDGDILKTNQKMLFVKVIAQKEELIEINSNSLLNLLKTAYHLGNRHIDIEIDSDSLFIKKDYVIENLLKNFNVNYIEIKKKFFPEVGAYKHE